MRGQNSTILDQGQPSPGGQDWYSISELAQLELPGLGADRRKIARRASDERWDQREDASGQPLARARAGRGGGVEYHFSALPGTAQLELSTRNLLATRPQPAEAQCPTNARWEWFDRQSAKVKSVAERRMAILAELELLESSGMTRTVALAQICQIHDVKRSAVFDWIKRIRGVRRHHWLAFLAPERKGGGAEAEIPDDLWNTFISDYLRPERPTLASCYHRVAKIAKARGTNAAFPSEAAFRRRLKRDVDVRVQQLRRGLKDEFKRAVPDNRRSVEGMAALDLVNIDGHTFDVWVEHPEGLLDGKGNVIRIRPTLIAIQDIYSRKMLAWRLDLSENYLATRLAFADLFRNYGIPKACLLDNSRTFAGKQLTGGTETRYRHKVIEGEAYGLLPSLGIQVRFAQIYHGQAKPIERAFRDLADYISRGPACAGAYAGNSVANKPTNVGTRAVPWEEFVRIVDDGIADHNAREGRRGGVCNGRSFDQVFADSYATAPIRKATPQQLRIALFASEQKTVNSRTGAVSLLGNEYWSPDCGKFRGQKVIVRYDPEDLLAPIYLYSLESEFLCEAQVQEGFLFTEAKGAHAAKKRRREYAQAVREAEKALDLRDAAEIAALTIATEAAALPEASVVQTVRHRNQVAKVKPVAEPKPVAQVDTKVLAGLQKAMLKLVVE